MGRPPKYTEDNPKPKVNSKNPLEVIRPPKLSNGPSVIELPEGDNNKYTTFALAVMQLPKLDLHKPELVRQRVHDYFQLCADCDMKPGIVSASLALGIDRRRMWEINTDHPNALKIPQESKDAIKLVYTSMELLWESWMQNGKINPVSGIFLGRNHWGYQDKIDLVVTPNTNGIEAIDAKAIEAKYAELPEE